MSVTKIEQLIEDIYDFVENCKQATFSSTKVIVPKDELYDYLDELRLRTPDEIKRCQKIIQNRDAIISDAENKSKAMLANATEQTNLLVNDSEIVQNAYQKANEIITHATNEANRILTEANAENQQIRESALYYTNDLLTEAQSILMNTIESSTKKHNALVETLQRSLDVIASNKQELMPNQSSPIEQYNDSSNEEAAGTQEEYEFDEDTFLNETE